MFVVAYETQWSTRLVMFFAVPGAHVPKVHSASLRAPLRTHDLPNIGAGIRSRPFCRRWKTSPLSCSGYKPPMNRGCLQRSVTGDALFPRPRERRLRQRGGNGFPPLRGRSQFTDPLPVDCSFGVFSLFPEAMIAKGHSATGITGTPQSTGGMKEHFIFPRRSPETKPGGTKEIYSSVRPVVHSTAFFRSRRNCSFSKSPGSPIDV